MNGQSSNVVTLNRRVPKHPATTLPPGDALAVPVVISEAIAMAWELRLQLVEIKGMSPLQRRRTNTLARHIEDRLVYALNHLVPQP